MRKQLRFVTLFLSFFSVFPLSLLANELTINNELFVEIEEMIVPVVQKRDVAGFFSIILAVDCKTQEASEKITKYLPIVRDRLFWDLYVLLGVIWSPDFRANISEMKKRLRRRLDLIIGPDQINDVLVISFQQHERRNIDF